MGVQIEGDKELLALLRKVADEVAPGVVKEITIAGATEIEKVAQEKAPVDTGALRDSISSDPETVSFDSVSVAVGPTVEYADDVEFGRLQRPAQPYLRPAADEAEDAAVKAVADALRNALRSL